MWTKRSKENKKARPVSDVGRSSKGRTVVLRERVFHIEISRTKAVRFLRDHKLGVLFLSGLIVALVFVRYALVGFASTADFYPSSCLGSWQNVANALGEPDLPQGAPASAFTTANSASLGTSTAQMFCGNFSGDTDISLLDIKPFESADLVLSWTLVFPSSTVSSSLPAAGSGGGGGGGGGASVPASDASSSPVVISTSTTTSTIVVASSTSISTSTASTTTTVATTTDDDNATGTVPAAGANATSTASATTTAPTTPAVASTTIVASSSDDDTSADTTTPVVASTTEPAPTAPAAPDDTTSSPPAPTPAPDTSDASASSTSWLMNLVGVAYADGASSTVATSSVTLTTTTALTPTGTMTVNTTAFQNIELPSSSAEDVLGIVYSTDGVTWQPLININQSNWQQARYPLPINSWDELSHLQIAFVGLGASSTPQIYLDAVGVEVSYVDTPDGTVNVTPVAPSTDTDSSGDSPIPLPPPPPQNLPTPTQALQNAFSPWAAQTCTIDPFSASVSPGDATTLLLKLTPPEEPSSSVASSSFLYDVSIGTLPYGVTAYLTTSNPGNDTIALDTTAFAPPGSYSVVVVYRERQKDGSILPNYCQFNLNID